MVMRLIVLADDWGRHPSSCQHLIRCLLERHPTIWVDTIGMRRPQVSQGDIRKLIERLQQWTRHWPDGRRGTVFPNLTVLTPYMWPGFGRAWQQRMNASLISRALHRALPAHPAHSVEKRVVFTT